jgi:hypothetical protein
LKPNDQDINDKRTKEGFINEMAEQGYTYEKLTKERIQNEHMCNIV